MAKLTNRRIGFFLERLRERLWVRPLAFCVLSVAGVFFAKSADGLGIERFVPEVSPDSIEALLSIVASSMLVVATFAVGSMVSAYASAAGTATPRSFPLLVSDDTSQHALSAFIGAFIFSIVALVAMKNGYFEKASRFALFALTIGVFAWVVVTFVRWVDKIARLGRMGNTVEKIEVAAADALRRRREQPRLGGLPVDASAEPGEPVFADRIGYVQHIDVPDLQRCAEAQGLRITVAALPGKFAAPGTPLMYYVRTEKDEGSVDTAPLVDAFEVGDSRVFEHDPRFGLIALSEIAARALSPAVNDPGTAIDIIGRFVRLFADWSTAQEGDEAPAQDHDRIHVPELSVADLFDDAFAAVAREGAGALQVQLRLQKALASLVTLDDPALSNAARHHGELALKRAQQALDRPEDVEAVAEAARWAQ